MTDGISLSLPLRVPASSRRSVVGEARAVPSRVATATHPGERIVAIQVWDTETCPPTTGHWRPIVL